MRWTSIDDLTRASADLADRHDAIAAVLGEAARAADPALAALLASHAAQHAWHAELWHGRRPVIAGRPVADVAAAPPDAPADVDGVYRDAVPELVGELTRWRAATDERIDAPTARVLDLVLADLRAQLDDRATASHP